MSGARELLGGPPAPLRARRGGCPAGGHLGVPPAGSRPALGRGLCGIELPGKRAPGRCPALPRARLSADGRLGTRAPATRELGCGMVSPQRAVRAQPGLWVASPEPLTRRPGARGRSRRSSRPRTGLGPSQVASLGEGLSAASSPGRAEPSSLGTPPFLPSQLRVNTRLPGPGITRGYFGARIKPETAWGRTARPRWPRRPCLAFASRGSEVVCSPRSAQVPGRGRKRGARGALGLGVPACFAP